MSANRHSQFNHITLKKCYTNQRHLWQRNIIPQLQLITHTSSPCIPFTYFNKGRGICQEGKYRLVRHARQQADVSVCMCVCTTHAEMWLRKKRSAADTCLRQMATENKLYSSITSTSGSLHSFSQMFYLVLHHVGIDTHADYSVANLSRHLSVCLFLLLLLHYFYLLFLSVSHL